MKQPRGKENHENRITWTVELINKFWPKAKKITILEIGVWKADFGDGVLRKTDERVHWIGIDPFVVFPAKAGKVAGQQEWDEIFQRVQKKVSFFGPRFRLIRKTAAEAASSIKNRSIHLLFVDGDHRYEFAKEDLELYEPKVKKGGIVSGHDYWDEGVYKAVHEFADERGIKIIEETFEGTGVWWWQK